MEDRDREFLEEEDQRENEADIAHLDQSLFSAVAVSG
jgi:hypothetical protein